MSLLYIINLPQTVWELWPAQDFCFKGDNYKTKEVRVVSLPCNTYWSSSSSLPNIIKLSQTVWELWPAQDFGFRGDDYTAKKVSIVSLACDTPTGPPLHSYQILSKYKCMSRSIKILECTRMHLRFQLQGR